MKSRGNRLRGTAAYTALFALFFLACWQCVLRDGGSPVWALDGRMQHLPFMAYIGRWLREALSALARGASVQRFDFALGYGGDVLTSLNYYGFGDPLLMLVAAVFTDAEAGYFALMVLRGWLAGLAAMALARQYRLDWKSSVLAGLVYAFSLSLFSASLIRHQMFSNPYIHFPLMLLGMERVFERRKPWLLSLAVCLSALCGFYFLYVNSVLLLLYAVLRQLTRGEAHPVRTLPAAAGRAIGWYALGIALSAVIFVPATMGFLHGQRTGTLSLDGLRLRYSLRTYLKMPLALISSRGAGAVVMMPALGVLGGAAALLRRRENRSLRAVALAGLILVLLPATGWVLNGFSYEAERWAYAEALLAAMLTGFGLNAALNLTKKEAWLLTGLTAAAAVYCAVAALRGWAGSRWNVVFPMAAMAGTMALMWIYRAVRSRKGRVLCAAALTAVLLVNLSTAYSQLWQARRGDMLSAGAANADAENSPLAKLVASEEFGRADAAFTGENELPNMGATLEIPTVSVYNSTLPGSLFQSMLDVNNAGLVHLNAVIGLDRRAALEALWSVNRYVSGGESALSAPYGFEETADGVYESANALPLGYAVPGAMTMDDYEALSPLEKQWALLQCAALEEIPEGISAVQPGQSLVEIPVKSQTSENIEWADQKERYSIFEYAESLTRANEFVAGENASITLTLDVPADCELYLEMENLAILGSEVRMDNYIYTSSGSAAGTCLLSPESFELTIPRESVLVNVGYDENARATVEIRFARAGRYRLSGIRAYAQPMADFDEKIEALQGRAMTDVQIENDAVSGRVSLDEPAVMVFSIPYTDGWTLTVDGAETPLQASAGAFLAAAVPAGDHALRLTYRTPGLRLGACVSAAALVALAVCVALERRKRKKEAA